jgi:hypothetical protein
MVSRLGGCKTVPLKSCLVVHIVYVKCSLLLSGPGSEKFNFDGDAKAFPANRRGTSSFIDKSLVVVITSVLVFGTAEVSC